MLNSLFEEHSRQAMENIEVDHQLKAELKVQLFDQSLKKKILSFIFITMKHYSFPALAGLTVLVFGIIAFFPNNSVVPLAPEEVLAQVQENYQEEGIYHEKVLFELYENEKLKNNELTEIYEDDFGNWLSIDLDPKTHEVQFVHLTRMDEFGDSWVYNNDPSSKWSHPVPSQLKENLERMKGEKAYCIQKMDTENFLGEIILVLSANDPSIYEMRGGMTSFDHSSYEGFPEWDIDFILENVGAGNSRSYIEALVHSESYDYLELDSGHLFKIPLHSEQSEYWFYFNDDYELEKYEIYFSEDSIDKMIRNTFFENEYIDASEADSIFDPDRFEGLGEGRMVPSERGLPFKIERTGCFDVEGKELEKGFFQTLPSEVHLAWQEMFDVMQVPMDSYFDKNEGSGDPL